MSSCGSPSPPLLWPLRVLALVLVLALRALACALRVAAGCLALALVLVLALRALALRVAAGCLALALGGAYCIAIQCFHGH
eukprot:16437115-Heterocapsa_arctica.AAC.1